MRGTFWPRTADLPRDQRLALVAADLIGALGPDVEPATAVLGAERQRLG